MLNKLTRHHFLSPSPWLWSLSSRSLTASLGRMVQNQQDHKVVIHCWALWQVWLVCHWYLYLFQPSQNGMALRILLPYSSPRFVHLWKDNGIMAVNEWWHTLTLLENQMEAQPSSVHKCLTIPLCVWRKHLYLPAGNWNYRTMECQIWKYFNIVICPVSLLQMKQA